MARQRPFVGQHPCVAAAFGRFGGSGCRHRAHTTIATHPAVCTQRPGRGPCKRPRPHPIPRITPYNAATSATLRQRHLSEGEREVS
ncbi:MAG: hypothetical protein WDW36_003513 [Sanguina aurantia]